MELEAKQSGSIFVRGTRDLIAGNVQNSSAKKPEASQGKPLIDFAVTLAPVQYEDPFFITGYIFFLLCFLNKNPRLCAFLLSCLLNIVANFPYSNPGGLISQMYCISCQFFRSFKPCRQGLLHSISLRTNPPVGKRNEEKKEKGCVFFLLVVAKRWLACWKTFSSQISMLEKQIGRCDYDD